MFKDFYSDFDEEKANHLLEDLKLDEKVVLKNLSKGNKEKVQLIPSYESERLISTFLMNQLVVWIRLAQRHIF